MKLLEQIANKYLSSKGFYIRPPQSRIPRPKIGDKVTFIVGGYWNGLESYTTHGIVTELKIKNQALKAYPYIRAVRKDNNGAIIADHIVHYHEILSVESE